MDLTDLYQSVILDHNRRPRNFRHLDDADRTAAGDNPVCGDRFTVFLKWNDSTIADIAFHGEGCAISKASGSLMTTLMKGKTAEEAAELFQEFHRLLMTGEFDPTEISDMSAFAGVHQFPARIKCATLAWHAALAAIRGETGKVRTEEE